jgi:hypoxanthine phosphoribosyltransferase
MPGKIYYSNEDMKNDLHDIIRQMNQTNFRPDVIVGIARGGLVPATMMSHYFEKPLSVINYSLRDNLVSHLSEITDLARALNAGKNVLIVDDICDSGETLRKVVYEACLQIPRKDWEDRLKVAVLWNNTAQDVFDPDYVGREISRAEDERWIIFSYESWWKA